jgi:hypothetical protein
MAGTTWYRQGGGDWGSNNSGNGTDWNSAPDGSGSWGFPGQGAQPYTADINGQAVTATGGTTVFPASTDHDYDDANLVIDGAGGGSINFDSVNFITSVVFDDSVTSQTFTNCSVNNGGGIIVVPDLATAQGFTSVAAGCFVIFGLPAMSQVESGVNYADDIATFTAYQFTGTYGGGGGGSPGGASVIGSSIIKSARAS